MVAFVEAIKQQTFYGRIICKQMYYLTFVYDFHYFLVENGNKVEFFRMGPLV